MQFLLLVCTDETMLDALPEGRLDGMMRSCLQHADELMDEGTLLGFQQFEPPATAESGRVRDGRTTLVDGPFAESKEVLGGFNLIEAADYDEAVRIASGFPWAGVGCSRCGRCATWPQSAGASMPEHSVRFGTRPYPYLLPVHAPRCVSALDSRYTFIETGHVRRRSSSRLWNRLF